MHQRGEVAPYGMGSPPVRDKRTLQDLEAIRHQVLRAQAQLWAVASVEEFADQQAAYVHRIRMDLETMNPALAPELAAYHSVMQHRALRILMQFGSEW